MINPDRCIVYYTLKMSNKKSAVGIMLNRNCNYENRCNGTTTQGEQTVRIGLISRKNARKALDKSLILDTLFGYCLRAPVAMSSIRWNIRAQGCPDRMGYHTILCPSLRVYFVAQCKPTTDRALMYQSIISQSVAEAVDMRTFAFCTIYPDCYSKFSLSLNTHDHCQWVKEVIIRCLNFHRSWQTV